MDNRRTGQNLSIAFESRDAGLKQGIFGRVEAAQVIAEAWTKIAKNFTVSLPRFTLSIRKKCEKLISVEPSGRIINRPPGLTRTMSLC
jgi:hypothetical protein